MQYANVESTLPRTSSPLITDTSTMRPAENIKAGLIDSFLPVHSNATYGMTSNEEDFPRRRSSLYYDSLVGNGKHHDDGICSFHGRLQSRLHQHEHRRMDFIHMTCVYSWACRSILALLTIERQKDIDLDTLRLQRACGMTIDTINMSKPWEPFQSNEIEAADRNGIRKDSGNIRNEDCISPVHFRSHSLTNTPRNETALSPAFCSSPASPAFFLDLDDMDYHRPPSFAPLLDPHRQFASLEVLLKRYQQLFNVDGSSADSGPIVLEGLINVGCLLLEHAVNDQQKTLCTGIEGASGGLSSSERLHEEKNDEANGTNPRPPMTVSDTNDPAYRVFGQPLPLSRLYASCVSAVAGYQQELPIVVHACIEELYRTGMTVPGLFRSAPNHTRHSQLIELFDTGPAYGRSVSLSKESTADICALLLTYIDRLPRAIWHETLFDAMLKLCVLPTVRYEKAVAEVAEDNETCGRTIEATSKAGARRPISLIVPNTPPPSLGELGRIRSSSLNDITSLSNSLSGALSFVGLSQINTAREKPQLAAASLLFRLLPRAQLALLVYLCGFFTQLPLSPHNQLTIEDIARLFAVPLFLGKPDDKSASVTNENWNARKDQARAMMVWILRRWSYFSEGLFDIDVDEELEGGTVASATSDDSESVPLTFNHVVQSDGYRTSESSSSGVSPQALELMPGGHLSDDLIEDRCVARDDMDT